MAGRRDSATRRSPAKPNKRRPQTKRRPLGRPEPAVSRASGPRSKAVPVGPGAKRKKRSARAGADLAGLAVELTVSVAEVGLRENKRVALDGLIRRPGGVDKRVFPRLQDREAAARRITRGAKPDRLARLLAALAHPQRIRILLKLLGGEATHQLLSKTTKLKAGPLYHHLGELRSAGLIGPKVRDLYVLTPPGRRAILATLALGRISG